MSRGKLGKFNLRAATSTTVYGSWVWGVGNVDVGFDVDPDELRGLGGFALPLVFGSGKDWRII